MEEHYNSTTKSILKGLSTFLLYSSLLCVIAIVMHTGFHEHAYNDTWFNKGIIGFFYFYTLILLIKILLPLWTSKIKTRFNFPELLLTIWFITTILDRNFHILLPYNDPAWVYVGFFAVFVVELSKNVLFFDRFFFNPTLLFIVSFLFMIFLGTVLLLLPKVMNGPPLNFVDALFMSTSAVCITGLSVIDVSTDFTLFGQTVLIILVQLGGLGMMTFTGFFGYFFSGGFSYKNQIMYTEILGEKKINSVISALLRIILITLLFEAIGALFIYYNVGNYPFGSHGEKVFFSIFHAISAFCNAGFSTVPDGLSNINFQFNYGLHVIVSLLFILGGLGFAIVFNTFTFVKRWLVNFYLRIFKKLPFEYRAWVINFNARLIGYTTFYLLLFSTLIVFILEYHKSLAVYQELPAKLMGAFFLSSTPRSAGFSNIDIGSIGTPSIIILLVLMWIGASPGSTGGGIKTTTFAVATLNLMSLTKGKERLEVFGRRISQDSIKRAFAIICLSFIGISLTVFGLTLTDSRHSLKAIIFECVSAYNTVGLSLGITDSLSRAGKIIIALAMFIGRVGALTLLLAFVRKSSSKKYEYPEENVLY